MGDGAPPEAVPCWVANRDASDEFRGNDHDHINDADDRFGCMARSLTHPDSPG
jgi:hypothetical protein